MSANHSWRKSYVSVAIALCIFYMSAIPAFAAKTSESPPVRQADGSLSENLRQEGPNQKRWMSLPESRLVVNPFNFGTPESMTQAQYSNRPSLPLNIGYMTPWPVQGKGVELSDVLTVYDQSDSAVGLEKLWTADFNDSSKWAVSDFENPNGAIAAYSPQSVSLKVKDDPQYHPWQSLATEPITINMDENPLLEISVHSEAMWSLKIYDLSKGSTGDERVLRGDGAGNGVQTFDLANLIPDWKGQKQIKLRIFEIGYGTTLTIDKLQIVKVDSKVQAAETYSTTWAPHELGFQADYKSGLSLEGYDFFYDANTVVRRLNVTRPGINSVLSIAGKYRGTPTWDAATGTLFVSMGDTQGDQRYAIAFGSTGLPQPTYYESYVDMLSGIQRSEAGAGGYWKLDVPVADITDKGLTLSFSIGTYLEPKEKIAGQALAPFARQDAEAKLAKRRLFWDDLLGKAPIPSPFEFKSVDAQGVTFEDIRKQYYDAWVFTAANIIPPAPEIGYPYPQIATGKPSLWAVGHPSAAYSASWESLLAMQQYAYIDPNTAWNAFKGMMSLVDENGLMAGESLPSRKAQTAYILFRLTKDFDSLKEIYPALERYLLWRMDNPRWIIPGHDIPSQKDAEFAVSALVDIQFLIDISRVLGLPRKAEEWEQHYEQFYAKYTGWFWKTPGGFPYQYYDTDSGAYDRGNTLWTATGLNIDRIEDPYKQSLYDRFMTDFEPDQPFAGLIMPKYPDISYTTYGLIRNGHLQEARVIIESMIRDLTKANFFSEQYVIPGDPYPQGVRPSHFGASMLIDNVLMRDGLRSDLGAPAFMNIFGEDGSVRNVRINGKTLDMTLDAGNGQVRLSGPYVERPISIEAPAGKVVTVPEWESPQLQDIVLAPGETARLPLDSSTYRVFSDSPETATVSLEEGSVLVTAHAGGQALVTVVSGKNGYSDAIHRFAVSVADTINWKADLGDTSAWRWDDREVKLEVKKDGLHFTAKLGGHVETTIEGGAAGLLEVSVPKGNATWGISLVDTVYGVNANPIVVREPSRGEGTFLYDLEKLTSGTGEHPLHLRIDIDHPGGTVTVGSLQLLSKPNIAVSPVVPVVMKTFTDTHVKLATVPEQAAYDVRSEDPGIAVGDMNGDELLLHGLGVGETTVWVSISAPLHTTKRVKVPVTVIPSTIEADPIGKQFLTVGKSTVVPTSAHVAGVTLQVKSGDPSVVAASAAGDAVLLEGVSAGQATVTLTYLKDGYVSLVQTFEVSVMLEGSGWQADFANLGAWTAGYPFNEGGLRVEQINGGTDGVKLTVTDKANPVWQPFYTTVKVNLDETSVIKLQVPEAAGSWTIKVGTPEMPSEIALKPEDSATGTFVFDLSRVGGLEGWRGVKSFNIAFYMIGTGSTVTLKSLEIGSRATIE